MTIAERVHYVKTFPSKGFLSSTARCMKLGHLGLDRRSDWLGETEFRLESSRPGGAEFVCLMHDIWITAHANEISAPEEMAGTLISRAERQWLWKRAPL